MTILLWAQGDLDIKQIRDYQEMLEARYFGFVKHEPDLFVHCTVNAFHRIARLRTLNVLIVCIKIKITQTKIKNQQRKNVGFQFVGCYFIFMFF